MNITTTEQPRRHAGSRAVLRWVLAALFGTAGVAHLAVPEPFLTITPDWVPFAPRVIFATGLCELAGAAALVASDVRNVFFAGRRPRSLFGRTLVPLRRTAGIALAAYAFCVWPANIKQAVDHIVIPPIPDSWWYHAPRLALQPVIMWAALFSAGVIDWPFAALRRRGSQGRPPA